MPISQETKDQIDDLATDIAALETGKERRQEINAALTNYVEKLEEKDKIIESKDIELTVWKDTADKFKRLVEENDKEIAPLKQQATFSEEIEKQLQIRIEQDLEKLESKDRELAELKSWHDYYKERAEKGESILKSATDIHFVPGKEGENLLESKDRELAQLKEIAKNLYDTLTNVMNNTAAEGYDTKALTAYAEWCKQNLK